MTPDGPGSARPDPRRRGERGDTGGRGDGAEPGEDVIPAADAPPDPKASPDHDTVALDRPPTPPETADGSDGDAGAGGPRLHAAARTDRGLHRTNNEDAVYAGTSVLVVADGMGGHAAGEVASQLVVDAFAALDDEVTATGPPADLERAVRDATRTGNRAIARLVAHQPELSGMGTTVTAMLFTAEHLALAHVGDSRAYLYRDGVLHQLTHDDTFVQSLVDEGRITEGQARDHPQRNLVLRALTGLDLDPAVTLRRYTAGDRYLLCSDGLAGVVDAEHIAGALAAADPAVAADTLLKLTMAYGAPDNVTVIVADVRGGGDEPMTSPSGETERPDDTHPIAQLTRELPRVPLPPIPEEPAAEADFLPDAEPDEDEPADPEAADPAGGLAAGVGVGGGRARSERTRRWVRRGALATALVTLVAVALTGASMWVRTQYFVSDHGGLVGVYQGVDGSVLGWPLASYVENSCRDDPTCRPIALLDLQPAAREQVEKGITAGDLAEAREIVARLAAVLLPPCPESARGTAESIDGDGAGGDGADAGGAAVVPDDAEAFLPTSAPAPSTALPSPRGARSADAAGSGRVTVTRTVTATPLAPAAAIPGVTCRIVDR